MTDNFHFYKYFINLCEMKRMYDILLAAVLLHTVVQLNKIVVGVGEQLNYTYFQFV